MITADFTIIPIVTEDTACNEYVTKAVQIIKDSRLNYRLTGMGTQIEAENYQILYDVISKAQEALFKTGTHRVYTILKIDDRRDRKNSSLNQKVESVNELLSKNNNQ
ncbi:MAG: MTH1187 family thiamine-binding protein [Methanosphaera sp.]|nr:MTH1187 family thiamine-binding protein [Methanosphaera sp.]